MILISPTDLDRLGQTKGHLFIQLARFPNHYLVLLVKSKGFSYALITTTTIPENPFAPTMLEDIAFLDFERIRASRQGPDFGTSSNTSAQGLSLYDFKDWVNDTGASSG